jgi:adenylate kinase family enzyme
MDAVEPEQPMRIAVVGTSGAGKTTLARRLAQHLGLTHVELDAIHWGPGWAPIPQDVLRDRVAGALEGDAWVIDGNYGAVRDIVWTRADTLVWLDYTLPVVMGRVTWRTLRRSLLGEELWNGNRERLRTAAFSRDSIIWWALSTYRRRKREYPLLFSKPEYAYLDVVHLRSPRQARDWLEGLPASPRSGHSESGG